MRQLLASPPVLVLAFLAFEARVATREVDALRSVAHPHVVRFWDAWTTPQGAAHVVMELLGPSLADLCRQAEQRARLNYDVVTYQLVHGVDGGGLVLAF